jgi:hypothetical protein
MSQVLRVSDGRMVTLGDAGELIEAQREISGLTRGSSLSGRFSYLFGLTTENVLPTEIAARLGQEAAEFQILAGDRLSDRAKELLSRLASLRSEH